MPPFHILLMIGKVQIDQSNPYLLKTPEKACRMVSFRLILMFMFSDDKMSMIVLGYLALSRSTSLSCDFAPRHVSRGKVLTAGHCLALSFDSRFLSLCTLLFPGKSDIFKKLTSFYN